MKELSSKRKEMTKFGFRQKKNRKEIICIYIKKNTCIVYLCLMSRAKIKKSNQQ